MNKKFISKYILYFILVIITVALVSCGRFDEVDNERNSEMKESIANRLANLSNKDKENLNIAKVEEKDFLPDKRLLKFKAINDFSGTERLIDTDGTEYEFYIATGKYVGFSKSISINFDYNVKHSKNELESIADSVASIMIDIDKYEYREYRYQEDTAVQKFFYRRIINSYKTTEHGGVWLNNDGIATGGYFYNNGLFDDLTIPEIDYKKLEEEFSIELNKKYGTTNYSIYDCILDYKDNVFYMNFDAAYEVKNSEFFSRDIISIPIK